MRWLVALVLATLAVGCGDDGEGESGACAAAVVYHDMAYVGIGPTKSRLRPGEPLDGGIEPACRDTSPADPDERDRATGLRRIVGVAPEVAVYVPGRGRRNAIYVNAGSFPELPDHPLHEAIYGSPRRPRSSLRGVACTIEGTIAGAGPSIEVRTTAGRTWYLHGDVRTRIDGFDRGGSPVLREDDRVHVVGRCRRPDVLARRIGPQP